MARSTAVDESRGFLVRPTTVDDLPEIMDLTQAVALEGRWIGTEAGFDRAERSARFMAAIGDPAMTSLVAVATGVDGSPVIANLGMEIGGTGVAEFGMMVAADWRGRGVGAALLDVAIVWARSAGAHKVALHMWPGNDRARALYEKAGFVDEGVLVRHYRRANGQLWDAVVMGLVLDTEAPGGPPD